MALIYFIEYEVIPAPMSEMFATVGGAYANCFVTAADETAAQDAAQENFRENGWRIISLEDGPFLVERDSFEDDPEWLECLEEALREGECYVFHQWPPEVQEDDGVH